MTTLKYIRFLSLLENGSENTKIIRLWALRLNDELVDTYLNNPSIENTEFLRSMALQNILDEKFLKESLIFINTIIGNPKLAKLLKILSLYPNCDILPIVKKLLKIEDYKLEAILSLFKIKPLKTSILTWANEIINTTSKTKAEAIITIYSSRTPLGDDIYEYFLTKLKAASTKETIENILIEYHTYVNDIIKRNAEIFSLSPEELIKSLELCPDLLSKNISLETLEIAISRHLKRQSKTLNS